jgi:hypothetical protein
MNLILFISMISLITTRSFFFPKSKNYLVREIKMKKNNFYNSGKYNFNCNYNPKNTNQYKYVNFLNDNDIKIVMAIGSAGTGKTLFACLHLFSFKTPILLGKKIRKNVKSIVGIAPTMVLLFHLPCFYLKM